MTFTVRDAVYPADAEALAAVWSAANPSGTRSAAQLNREQEQRDPSYPFLERVAVQDGRIVALARLGSSDSDRAFQGRLFVHPDEQRRGIGTALYDDLLNWARPHRPRCRVNLRDGDDHAAGRAFLEKYGWQINHRRIEFKADLASTLPPLTPLATGSIQLRPLSELLPDPQAQRWLYELDWELFLDVPLGHSPTKRPFERWHEQELASPSLHPALSLVAVSPAVNDPLTGPLLGWVTLEERTPHFFVVGMTGVKRSWRGQGIAKALKLASMHLLQNAGESELHTMNDLDNAPIVHLNEQLGFTRSATICRYELHLQKAEG